MSDVPQTCLPDELIHAIVTQMWDRDEENNLVKRGLASCSLTCRHWASLIRPLLFYELTIRSAKDLAQLLAFLNSFNPLHPSLWDCIGFLHVVDGRTSSSIPWSHQIFRLHRRIVHIYSMHLTIEKSSADDELPLGHNSSQPLTIIPRTLPGSIMPLERLTLSHLRLPSVKALANYVQYLHVGTIALDAVTFVKEDVPDIRRLRPHSDSDSRPSVVAVSHCFEDIAGFLRWSNIANVLHACRGRLWVDDECLSLAEKYMVILLSVSPHRDGARMLQTSDYPVVESPEGEDIRYTWPRRDLTISSSLAISILSR